MHSTEYTTMFAATAQPSSQRQRPRPAIEDNALPESLILHIAHDGAHSYRARMFDERDQIGNATYHSRIDEAIRWYGEHSPVASVKSFRIWYGGWCAGNFLLADMEQDADDIAERLLVLAVVAR
jgi:hypothetical protein